MPNQLNKNKNKLKGKDEIRTAQKNLILAQQAERRQRFQQITHRHRSTEELLEETRQRVESVEEAREEFSKLYSSREENPNGRKLTRTARSVEGARAWSELFVHHTLPEQTISFNEDPSSPKNTVVGNNVNVEVQSNGVGIQGVGFGVQSVGVGIQSVGAGVQNVDVAVPNSAHTQNQVIMAGPKEKLPKFDGDRMVDPIRHYKTCETIWRVNGITDTNKWVRQFLTTLRG